MPSESARRQVPDAADGGGQRPHGPPAKAERVVGEVVVVEHRPGPADDRVGVQVRPIGQLELGDQALAHGVRGRPGRRCRRRRSCPSWRRWRRSRCRRRAARGPPLRRPRRRSRCRACEATRITFSCPMPSQPATLRAGVVALLRAENDGLAGQCRCRERARQGLFQADLHAVQQRAGAAEGEHAAGRGRIVADEPAGDRGDADLGLGEAAAAFVAAQVRVVHARQDDADDAGDRRDGRRRSPGSADGPMISMPSSTCTSCGITASSVCGPSRQRAPRPRRHSRARAACPGSAPAT